MISQTSTTDFTWGVNAHNRPWNQLSTAQELDLAKTIGLTSLRVDIYDASPDWINWLSSLVSEASSKGISIMPVIVPNQSVCRDEATAYAWGQQVGSALATAFPHLTWEAGNELDEFAIKSGTTGQSASDYDEGRYGIAMGAIKGLEDGIHQADPTAHVAVGITGIHYAFLQRLVRDGVSWDITGETYYIGHGDTQIPEELDGVFSQLAQFNRPILVTEFNQFEGSLLSPTEEANTLVSMMSTMKNLAAKYNITGAYIYELVDEPPLTGGEAHYGLASQTGSLNPAGLAVQQYLASLLGVVTTVIESSGATTLAQVANNYFLFPVGGSSGPELSYNGAPFVAGQSGAWTPIGAEKTASGYEVAWHLTGADQYTVWNTDSSGNYISSTGVVSGLSSVLQVAESILHQDLNGDGTTGLHTTVIEGQGSTSLVQVANNYFLFPVGGSSGPELSYNGAPFVAGQSGAWTPIGAEKTASGYEVAWHLTGADQYTVWNTDSSGNYISGTGIVSGLSSQLQVAESILHQDLNGDGTTGLHTTVIEARVDQPGSGREQLFPVSGRRIVGP